jgi:hypothetical protein
MIVCSEKSGKTKARAGGRIKKGNNRLKKKWGRALANLVYWRNK